MFFYAKCSQVANNSKQQYIANIYGRRVILWWIFACHFGTFYINVELKDATIYVYAPNKLHLSSLKSCQDLCMLYALFRLKRTPRPYLFRI